MTKIKQDAFNEINRIVVRNNLFTYTNFHERFKIHTDASNFQLGAVIVNKRKPIDFYCGSITDAHKKVYRDTEGINKDC